MPSPPPPDLPQPNPTTLLTPRLRLRTAHVSDAAAVQPFITDETTMKYSSTGHVARGDLGAAERWLRARVLGWGVFNFLITLRGEGEEGGGDGKEEVVVGMMGSHHWPEVGYLLSPAHTRKGYATEALQAFIPAFFAHMSSFSPSSSSPSSPAQTFNYIEAVTDSANTASQNVLLKCGFKHIQRLVGDFDSPVLGVRDTYVFRVGRVGVEVSGEGEGEDGDAFVPPLQ